jgi:hypothetical protein
MGSDNTAVEVSPNPDPKLAVPVAPIADSLRHITSRLFDRGGIR